MTTPRYQKNQAKVIRNTAGGVAPPQCVSVLIDGAIC